MSKKAIILFRVVAFLLIAHCLCVYDGRHSITHNGLQLPEGREFENEITLKN